MQNMADRSVDIITDACFHNLCIHATNVYGCAGRSYNARYAACLEGWEATRLRDLKAHTDKAHRAFSSAGGEALQQQLVEKAPPLFSCPHSARLLQRAAAASLAQHSYKMWPLLSCQAF